MNFKLQKLFDTAKYDRGEEEPYNAIDLVRVRYPYLGGWRVDVIHRLLDRKTVLNDEEFYKLPHIAIVEITSPNSPRYQYREATPWELERLKELDYDPYYDAGFARAMLDLFVPDDDDYDEYY